jgi:septal ring factor EnvC (AmiA/AmiB activator)
VAFGECVRAVAEQTATYAQALEELRRAEEVLRSCDQVLAADQDAQRARLSQIGARQSSLESELAQALNEERMIAAELSAAEEALEREGARLKRAEIELRAVQQRAGGSRADE